MTIEVAVGWDHPLLEEIAEFALARGEALRIDVHVSAETSRGSA